LYKNFSANYGFSALKEKKGRKTARTVYTHHLTKGERYGILCNVTLRKTVEYIMARMLTVNEVADRVGLHMETIRRYIREGKLPASKFGRVWRVAEEDLKVFIEERKRLKEL